MAAQYVRNAWYVAAWGAEVGREPMARLLLDEPVVMYRTADGTPVALEDRCCHRNMPLSMGMVEGDNLRCGYHGLVFDPKGCCVEVPGQSRIPPGAEVRHYPLVERWHLLWIWMGDPSLADPDKIPDWFYLDHPEWVAARGNDEKPLVMKCNYQLNNDNLLDLSHVAYLHQSSLGGEGFDRFPIKTDRLDDGMRMTRLLLGVTPMPIFAKYLGLEAKDAKVDRWQQSDITVPAHCIVDAGFAPSDGRVEKGDRSGGFGFRALVTATPETERTSFMFYAQCRNFALDNDQMTATFVKDFRNVFMEDVGAMEAQQVVNDRWPDRPTIDINVDAPHLAMRRLIDSLIAKEAKAATSQAAE